MNKAIEFYRHYFFVLLPALLVIAYFYITDPIIAHNKQLQSSMLENQDLVSWMQKSVIQLPEKPVQGTHQSIGEDPKAYIGKVLQLAERFQLQSKLKNIKPVNNNAIQMRFESVNFNQFIGMLEALLQMGNTEIVSLRMKVSLM